MTSKNLLKISIVIMIIGLIVIISSFYYYDKIDTIARKQEVTDDDLEEQRSYTGIMTIILIIGLFLCVIGGMIFHKNYPPIEDREKKFESYNLPSKVGFECPSCGGELTFDNQINIWRCNDCYKYL